MADNPIPRTKKNYRSTKSGAGMSAAGIEAHKKANPKTKSAKARKKSFCARSAGWTGERGKAARKRWKC